MSPVIRMRPLVRPRWQAPYATTPCDNDRRKLMHDRIPDDCPPIGSDSEDVVQQRAASSLVAMIAVMRGWLRQGGLHTDCSSARYLSWMINLKRGQGSHVPTTTFFCDFRRFCPQADIVLVLRLHCRFDWFLALVHSIFLRLHFQPFGSTLKPRGATAERGTCHVT